MITIDENLLIVKDCMLAFLMLSAGFIGFKYFKLKTHLNKIKDGNLVEKTNKELVLKQNLEMVEYNIKIDQYLKDKLDNLFNSFIFKGVLYTLRQYSNAISENEKTKLRTQFLEYLEFNLTETEKTIFMSRFVNFELFKYLVIDFFNIKLNKLELVVCHKLEIDDKEFNDIKLITSLYNNLTQKEIKNLVEVLHEINSDSNAPQNNKKDK